MELKRNFTNGVMNKDLDDRLLPDGSFRDALNMTVGTSSTEDQGTIRNIKGNTSVLNIETVLTSEGYTLPLPGTIKCIGSFSHTVNNDIYWFLTSSAYDMIVKYHENDNGSVVSDLLLIDIRPSGVINFSTEYLITGVNIIGDLLFWTDNLNPPRRININKKYRPSDVTNDTVSVIVKPPLNPPSITLVNTSGPENNIKDKFLRFAYRWKYENNEYSALSPFSEVAFSAGQFKVDFGSGENVGMQNQFNAVDLTFEVGGANVKEIQLIFKDTQSLNASVIDSIPKSTTTGSTYTYRFDNNKIYSVLDSKQITRLFDNVPLKAQAQEIIGNRLAFGNYVQFFDLKNGQGDDITPQYNVSVQKSPTSINSSKSWKTARDYEVGISYLDEYGRMTPVVTSTTNTMHIPSSNAGSKNELFVNVSSVAPAFAKYYRFFVKQNRGLYYNIIPTAVYADGLFVYFKLSDYDVSKAKQGDYIYIKSTYQGIYTGNNKFKVVEVASKDKDFLGKGGSQDAGVYLKLKVDNGQVLFGSTNTYNYKSIVKGYSGALLASARDPFTVYRSYVENPVSYSGALYAYSVKEYCNTIKDRRFYVEVLSPTTIRYRDFFGTSWSSSVVINSQTLVYNGVTYTGNYIEENGVKLCFIVFSSSANNVAGSSYRVNLRGSSKSIFGSDTKFVTSGQLDGGFAACPAGDGFGDYTITPGSRIRLKVDETKGNNNQPEQVFISSGTYENIEEWFFEDGIHNQFKQYDDNGVDKGSHTVFFRDCSFVGEGNDGIYVSRYGISPGKPNIRMFIKGWHVNSSTDTVRNQVTLDLWMFIPSGLTILETEGENIDSDIFYEMPGTYPVVNGRHSSTYSGDVPQTINAPGILKLRGFNAFSYSNGMESSVVNDDFSGPYISNPPRASSFTENYEQIRAESSICYSGTYAQNTNTNNLNEFNLSIANFKVLDRMYGPIRKLYSRDNDLVVFQEDKVSKVLYEKNLLYDAVGGGSVASIPEVLGTNIPYAGEYGMSYNPESFAKWGNDVFFTDSKRGAVLNLTSGGIVDISNAGMKTWFRDMFEQSPLTQKIGAFDPFSFQYVLSNNSSRALACEFNISKTSIILTGSAKTNELIFRIESNTNWTLELIDTGSGTNWATLSTTSGYGNKDIYISVSSNLGAINSRSLTIRATGCGSIKNIPLEQSSKETIRKVIVVVGDNQNDGAKQTIQQNGWTSDSGSVYYKDNTNILLDAAFYTTGLGVVGDGGIPDKSDTVSVYGLLDATNTQGSVIKPFNPTLGNKVYYADTNTEYTDADSLIAAATLLTPSLVSGKYKADFTYNANGSNLYLIWDYRNRVASNGSGSSPSSGVIDPENITILNGGLLGSYTLSYNSGTKPVRYQVLDSNGNIVIDTGYIGLNSSANYNALKALGINDADIKLQFPYNGSNNNGTGSKSISKVDYGDHLLKVYSPVSGGTWSFSLTSPSLASVSISSSGYTTAALACASSGTQTVYLSGSSLLDSVIYPDSLGEGIFQGGDLYYKSGTSAYQINNNGRVINSSSCICGESSPPVVDQVDLQFDLGTPVSFKISASNNPTSYSLSSNCHDFILTGGNTGAVFSGDRCSDGATITVSVSANETVSYGFEVGSVSKLIGDSLATFTDNGPCISCILPQGLTFDSSTGFIAGIPTEKGEFNVSVVATNCINSSPATPFKITINAGELAVSSINLDITNPHESDVLACGFLSSVFTVVYHNGLLTYPSIRDIIFTDSGSTTPLAGNNKWYLCDNGQTYKVDNDGYVVDMYVC